MKKKLIALLLATTMVLGLAACSGGSSGETTTASEDTAEETGTDTELPVLKVAVMPFLNCLPVQYMIENGLDEANGFKIETVYFANGTAMNEALAADEWEVGTLSAAAVNSLAIYGLTAWQISDIPKAACILWQARIQQFPRYREQIPLILMYTETRTAYAVL